VISGFIVYLALASRWQSPNIHFTDLVIFCDEYIVLNVPAEIVFSCPINENIDWRVGGKFPISRIKATHIVNNHHYFTHFFHVHSDRRKLIDNRCFLRPFKRDAAR
jgi:hypothetical protein